jgi:D-alanyl-D-alanine endopeptidase (penicillin-binding protein 7)
VLSHAIGLLALVASLVASPALAANSVLNLASSSALVLDNESGKVLYGKNADSIVPIASITKLMTAMVVLDANLEPSEELIVTNDDVDWLRGSHSRLQVGFALSRDEMLKLALMASENRAASALGRHYPGGRAAFINAMNAKAQALGLQGTRFSDSTGLSSTNVSTAEDLAKMVRAAHEYPKIRDYSTLSNFTVVAGGRPLAFRNTNGLVTSPDWEIGLSKTGFINEAGRCLVMQATLAGRAVVIVLLDSWGRYTRTADAARIRKWLEIAAGYIAEPKARVAGKATARASSKAKVVRTVVRTKKSATVARSKAAPRPTVQSRARAPSL